MPGPRGPRGRRPATRAAERERSRSRSPMERERQGESGGMEEWWERLNLLRDHPGPAQHHDPGLYQMLVQRIEVLENSRADLEQKVSLKGDLIDPLNLTVSADMKEKIWDDKCVDLALLLVKSYQEDEEKDKRISGFQDEDGKISFKSVKTKKSKLTIDQWSTAFNILTSVYIEKRPQDIQGLLSYAELVRGAARDHPTSSGWRVYDGEFRTKKESDPTRPWGMVDNQLWLSIFCKPLASQSKNQDSLEKQSNNKGICHFFNSEKGCFRKTCQYSHSCKRCGKANHGKFKCRERFEKNEAKGSQSDNTAKPNEKQSSMKQPFRYGK